MKHVRLVMLVLAGLTAAASLALTSTEAASERVSATVNPSGRTVAIPSTAVEVAPGVFSLGAAVADGQAVEGYAIVHPRKAYHHRPGHSAGPGSGAGSSTCYGFFASGARWKVTEPYVLDTANGDGMPAAFVETETAAAFETWDAQIAFDLFGSRDTGGTVDGADTVSPDDKNEVFFGSISDPGAIAVTIVWGVFRGPAFQRQLVEYDVVFDDADYTWGDATLDASVMDYPNIAIHEFGHAGGLIDIYDSACSEVTMYGYGTEGETKKRTLEPPDITGVRALYP